MYPNLYYAFKDLFGIEIQGLRWVNSFGFFVALAFIAAAWILTLELKRKEKQELLTYKEIKIWIGKPASIPSLGWNGLLGFILGYKFIGAFMSSTVVSANISPQDYLLSNKGSWWGGIVLGTLLIALRWLEKKKRQLSKPEQRVIRMWPHDKVGDLLVIALIFGFLGAKIFHNLENLDELIHAEKPLELFLSFSGLTFYGGLIFAGIAIYWFCKKNTISFIPFLDAIAPAMMLAYAIGRIGCQVAGDGDWGIENPHPNPLSWLPNWMWSYNYPHNVIDAGISIPGCVGPYCHQLPIPVYPTPLYETISCLILFGILWFLRKQITKPGIIAGIYFLMNGIERFFVEKIRVNTQYHFLGINPTQAEIIAIFLMIVGFSMLVYFNKRKTTVPKKL